MRSIEIPKPPPEGAPHAPQPAAPSAEIGPRPAMQHRPPPPPQRLEEAPGTGGAWVVALAIIASGLWLGAAGGYVLVYVDGFNWQGLNLQAWIVLGAAAALPLVLIWLATVAILQALALRRTSRLLARTAERLVNPADTAAGETARLGDSIRGEIEAVNRALDKALERFASLDQGLRQQTLSIDSTTTQVDERARNVAATLDKARTRIEEVARTLSAEAEVAGKTVEAQSNAAQESATRALELLKKAEMALTQRTAALENAGSRAFEGAGKLAGSLESGTERLETVAETAGERAREIVERFGAHHKAMTAATDRMSAETTHLEAAMESQREVLGEIAELLAAQAKRIEEAVSGAARNSGAAAEQAAQTVRNAATAFEAEIARLRQAGTDAAGSFDEAAQRSQNAAQSARKALDSQQSAAESALQRHLDEARAALLSFGAATRQTIAGELEKLHEGLGQRLERLQLELDEALSENTTRFEDRAGAVSRAADAAEIAVGRTLSRFAERLGAVEEATNASIRVLNDAAESFEARLSRLPGQASEGAGEIRAAIEDEMTALKDVIQSAMEKAYGLTRAVRAVSRAAAATDFAPRAHEELPRDAYDLVRAGLPEGRHRDQPSPSVSLRRQAAEPQRPRPTPEDGREAAPALDNLARRLTRRITGQPQAESRPAPAPHAAAEPAAPREKSWRDILSRAETGDRPRHDTKPPRAEPAAKPEAVKAVERLQALAIDLDRALENDPPADLIERYLEGERNVFARRLASLHGPEMSDRIRRKYDHDGEFRADVDRYIEEFEAMLHEVARSDSDGVLAEGHLTSQTGKVYLMLANALGLLE
jgi:hypothetical protein